MTRRISLGLLGLLAALCWLSPAQAQEAYPTRPIRLIVPFAPGGTTDIVARAVAAKLGQRLKQSVVVDNRPGAGGVIGTDLVAKATPDGYTLLLGSSGPLAYNPSLYPQLPYDPVRDLTPVGMMCFSALVMVAGTSADFASVGELLTKAKASPGKYTYATAGVGSATHVASELFNALAGVKIVHVPYKGSGPATVAVVAGETSFAFTGQGLAWPLVASGKLRALGLASDHRSAEHPDVPTIGEAGVPGFVAEDWFALLGPARMPPAIVKRLHDAVTELLKDPDLKTVFTSQGVEIRPGTPEQLHDFIQSEGAKWGQVIRKANIKME